VATLHVLRVFCAPDDTGGNPLGVFLDGAEVPQAERQRVAAELAFSETVYVDEAARGELRIFTPAEELPLAGHPLVGTAWLLREKGAPPAVLRPPAGEVGVRFERELVWISAHPEWGPEFEFAELGSPAEVEALEWRAEGRDVDAWAWIDEAAGMVRSRVFVPGLGVPEDEATGSAALRLCAMLGREVEIRQGAGSVLYARPLDGGHAEVGGRVVLDEAREL
jgi:predicted PhzF superfamily epimerase YddE/YHI9